MHERALIDDGILDENSELELRDAQRIAARGPSDGAIYAAVSQRDLTPEERDGIERAVLAASQQATETPLEQPKAPPPFGQREHDLLLGSIDHVAHDWVDQLQQVRRNSESVEQLVLARAAKVKADITQLYLLGSAAMAEATRGEQVNLKLAEELQKMTEERAS
ncbi:hypothetical protein [Bradyrhizobium neotropicale]|uniref:hypothetical protein n=1 Tax=Bradyrhizobium neotropicale TaxID=1497615 RepID=UPI001AD76406|nr:hypothetical protein [Bradyrhizobium neotropicale]MBO4222001.1 hypothetical protein [Bradyrhizobium neotropicale]